MHCLIEIVIGYFGKPARRAVTPVFTYWVFYISLVAYLLLDALITLDAIRLDPICY